MLRHADSWLVKMLEETARSVWWWWLWFWTSRRATAEFAVVTASGAGVEGGVGGTKGGWYRGMEQWPMAQGG